MVTDVFLFYIVITFCIWTLDHTTSISDLVLCNMVAAVSTSEEISLPDDSTNQELSKREELYVMPRGRWNLVSERCPIMCQVILLHVMRSSVV